MRAVEPDIWIEASGVPQAAESAIDMVRRGGTVLLFAVYPESSRISVNPFHINEHEITVVGSLNNPHTHQRAIDLIASGRVDIASIVTHELPLADLPKALEPGHFPTAGKILIRPND